MNHPTNPQAASAAGVHAAGLRAAIAAEPAAPVVAGIQGAGGYGKSALLSQLAGIYQAAGIPVSSSPDASRDGAHLVDDAHLLDETSLYALRAIAEKPGARVVVAYRPGPRSHALSELIATLGAPVLLTGLGRDEVARGLPGPASREWIDWLIEQTGGVPRFVGRVTGTIDPSQLGDRTLPRLALEQFRHDFDQLGEHARACVTAMSVGAAPHPEVLASVLELDPGHVAGALASVRSGGLVDDHDMPWPIVRAAAQLLTPLEVRLGIVRRLVDAQLAHGGPVLPLVRPLLGARVALLPEATLSAAFEKGGDEALAEAPELAGRLFDAAVSAGVPESRVAARRARAAAAAGRLDEALRLADRVIVDPAVPDRALGVQVAASVLAHRGLLAQSADLCAWSVDNLRWSGDTAYAAVGLVGTGRLREADELLSSRRESGPPTSLSGAAAKLAGGVRESVTGAATSALSTLVRAAALADPVGPGVMLPDSPAAIAATVALHCGELDVAESSLAKAVESGSGGPLLEVRHRLLAAWVPLMRGDTVTARQALGSVPSELAARDRLLATALHAGIAGRDNDMTALTAIRGQARQAAAEHSPDLFCLLPLGELVVATARLHDQDWLTPYLHEAQALLSALGNPPLWTSMLTWKCLQAAVVVEDMDSAARHAADLGETAHHNPMSAAMAEAARMWLRVLDGQVDQDEAERAARGLHAAGLTWDGARLAGQAAIRTTDRKAMLSLLECARALQGKQPRPRAMSANAGEGELLSDREREVAQLVLAGLTYKQVGKRLFISAKTVEHHIGRIRQRLGCQSREELLDRLRELVGSEA
ncbi:regulatory LuxR family protein [Saccharopolyspora erythraea NRRL 2338]|uniref:Transcriptional regulator, LuxR family n=1 Tax=Saccharopolyspora erythraea (strain ATCC 11635 / DSM 40517 / JCM 4748 / NBRC 13426 / NCIMB 8594 / NRRL 2338) TaxID=405948 RepID=A4F6G7_SACEN|nr:LuxR C-terminal-related transcriptional regulator [Saccharopolyspora erythraea]EQD88096.1 LuxR family transcriptional regulator [Saccharopolyspora erythraea D]PFG93444.1 regulatory LuxR family protein [Saccharopolyspora erythraea NRRL 2338]QRK90316.1 helix-turn-helix transcriptional regulator [Saccharopolyspora erythraea]CAL99641.1 transcriptional regulator, LuxR family [Saccharopolyspora erythraea NRRL 2338]